MADYPGEKTIEPTPYRRQQARREGHVAKSHDLSSAVVLLAASALLLGLGGTLIGFLMEYCRTQLGGRAWLTLDVETVVAHWNNTLWTLGRYMLPILGLICLAGAMIHILQTGFLFLPQRLAIDISRIDPFQGFRRIFSPYGTARIAFGILKLIAVISVAGSVLFSQRNELMALGGMSLPNVAVTMGGIICKAALKICVALSLLAIIDYVYQWWRHEQDLKMTPQELREELRNLEGDPQIKLRRKQMRQDMRVQRVERSQRAS